MKTQKLMTKLFGGLLILFALSCSEQEFPQLNNITSEPGSLVVTANTPHISLSLDKSNYSNTLYINPNIKRYYLKAGNSFFSKKWDAKVRFCPGGNCSTATWSTVSPWKGDIWGTYRTDALGVARIDFEHQLQVGTYQAKFKPHQSTNGWSNQVNIVYSVTPEAIFTELTEYLIPNQDDIFIYNTTNYLTANSPVASKTRLQIEKDRNWCGYKVRPWRFTKSHSSGYWNPSAQVDDRYRGLSD